jgi:hypothetical protein
LLPNDSYQELALGSVKLPFLPYQHTSTILLYISILFGRKKNTIQHKQGGAIENKLIPSQVKFQFRG